MFMQGCVSEWCVYNMCECVWVLDCQGQTGSGSGLNPLHFLGPSLLATLLAQGPLLSTLGLPPSPRHLGLSLLPSACGGAPSFLHPGWAVG